MKPEAKSFGHLEMCVVSFLLLLLWGWKSDRNKIVFIFSHPAFHRTHTHTESAIKSAMNHKSNLFFIYCSGGDFSLVYTHSLTHYNVQFHLFFPSLTSWRFNILSNPLTAAILLCFLRFDSSHTVERERRKNMLFVIVEAKYLFAIVDVKHSRHTLYYSAENCTNAKIFFLSASSRSGAEIENGW